MTMDAGMNPSTSEDSTSSAAPEAAVAPRSGDAWQRRFGVPWDLVDRAARAVLERAAAASSRRFAHLDGAAASVQASQV